MMRQVIHFFQKVLGGTDAPSEQPAALNQVEERRAYVRHPTTVSALMIQTKTAEPRQIEARARDVSRGGISLVVRELLQAGDMISLQIPSAPGSTTTSEVLACVVHVKELAPGEWVLGCEFSDALNAEELVALGVQGPPSEDAEQRNAVRFVCALNASYELANDPSASSESAQVVNVSVAGIGLLTEKAIETGTLLNLRLENPTTKEARTTLACVVHVASMEGNHFRWGCNFLHELSHRDLKALL